VVPRKGLEPPLPLGNRILSSLLWVLKGSSQFLLIQEVSHKSTFLGSLVLVLTPLNLGAYQKKRPPEGPPETHDEIIISGGIICPGGAGEPWTGVRCYMG
jgi:hypothetical protein